MCTMLFKDVTSSFKVKVYKVHVSETDTIFFNTLERSENSRDLRPGIAFGSCVYDSANYLGCLLLAVVVCLLLSPRYLSPFQTSRVAFDERNEYLQESKHSDQFEVRLKRIHRYPCFTLHYFYFSKLLLDAKFCFFRNLSRSSPR